MTSPDTIPAAAEATMPPVPARTDRDWWVVAGMTIASASAAVASFSGLSGLAALAGWPRELAWLLPVTVDAFAMTSARVWLAASTRSRAARRFARTNALGAIAMSIAGNAAFHAVGAGLLAVSWPIVVIVGAVPAAVLGLTAHLHALRSRIEPESPSRDRRGSDPKDGTGETAERRTATSGKRAKQRRTRKRPRRRSDDELMTAARAADEKYRQAHGRPITRDSLRVALHISGGRASELRRRLAAERNNGTEGGTANSDGHS